ncbi:hypothetical protein KSP40_PGU003043 [Platanthera guangdongensis]|uniref:Uncharacterized protein n=1 Tax=Platanthera guangdongensis TaxID=2320717 RepID=A0ABR2LKJ5_9ASPA
MGLMEGKEGLMALSGMAGQGKQTVGSCLQQGEAELGHRTGLSWPGLTQAFDKINLGRLFRDKLELKALKDGSVSYAALEKKAELYEKLVRGELPDEEEKEKYCVDFFQKNVTKVESQQPEGMDTASCCSGQNKDCANDGSIPNLKPFSLGRTSAELDSDEHKRFVREVHQDASDAREKSMMLKLRRQEQEAARRQKLRLAFLRKQVEKLTSINQKSTGDGTS